VSTAVATLALNASWEGRRLLRSRRIWLLLIPPVAAPIGSVVADLYLRVPSSATAAVLGLLITAGLSSLVLLDLVALAVGEDLAVRADYLTAPLPQGRAAALAGRLTLVLGGTVGAYAVGAGAVIGLAGTLVSSPPSAVAPLLIPTHLAVGLVGLLLFLAGTTAAASAVTRSAAQGLVAGVLAGVVGAGAGSYFLLERTLSALFPLALAVVGCAALGYAFWAYSHSEG
jgi:hypothetical protein